jgi:hypothetical protein
MRQSEPMVLGVVWGGHSETGPTPVSRADRSADCDAVHGTRSLGLQVGGRLADASVAARPGGLRRFAEVLKRF